MKPFSLQPSNFTAGHCVLHSSRAACPASAARYRGSLRMLSRQGGRADPRVNPDRLRSDRACDRRRACRRPDGVSGSLVEISHQDATQFSSCAEQPDLIAQSVATRFGRANEGKVRRYTIASGPGLARAREFSELLDCDGAWIGGRQLDARLLRRRRRGIVRCAAGASPGKGRNRSGSARGTDCESS